jgi:hypothetical protein
LKNSEKKNEKSLKVPEILKSPKKTSKMPKSLNNKNENPEKKTKILKNPETS